MAKLQFAKYDDKGKVIGYTQLTSNDFIMVGVNIALLLITLAYGIIRAYEQYQEIMDPEKFRQIVEGFAPLGNLVADFATALTAYSKMEFKDGVYFDLSDNEI